MVSKSMFQRIYKAKIWQGCHFDVSYEINFFFHFQISAFGPKWANNDLFTWNYLYIEKGGLKYWIWSKITKAGLVLENQAQKKNTYLTNSSRELKVTKTIVCNKCNNILSKFLRKKPTNFDIIHGIKINRNSKKERKSLKWTKNDQNLVIL